MSTPAPDRILLSCLGCKAELTAVGIDEATEAAAANSRATCCSPPDSPAGRLDPALCACGDPIHEGTACP